MAGLGPGPTAPAEASVAPAESAAPAESMAARAAPAGPPSTAQPGPQSTGAGTSRPGRRSPSSTTPAPATTGETPMTPPARDRAAVAPVEKPVNRRNTGRRNAGHRACSAAGSSGFGHHLARRCGFGSRRTQRRQAAVQFPFPALGGRARLAGGTGRPVAAIDHGSRRHLQLLRLARLHTDGSHRSDQRCVAHPGLHAGAPRPAADRDQLGRRSPRCIGRVRARGEARWPRRVRAGQDRFPLGENGAHRRGTGDPAITGSGAQDGRHAEIAADPGDRNGR